MVLFLVGMLLLVLINARKLSNHVRENISLTVFLHDSLPDPEVARLQGSLKAEPYIRSVQLVTKEEAAAEFRDQLGEDFVQFLGYNPLRDNFDVRLVAEYANNDSLRIIKARLEKNPAVVEVYYHGSLVDVVNSNVRKIGLFLLCISVLLSIISVGLIHNSIRLFIYSRRFLIRSMQLVGATSSFIRKPFLVRALWDAAGGSALALAMLTGVIFLLEKNIPELIDLHDADTFMMIFLFVPVLGLFITLFSTFFAVRKYLRLQTEELYK